MRYANVLGAAPFVLIGAFAIAQAQRFPDMGSLSLGPRFFPLVMGGSMIVLGVLLTVLSVLGRETLNLKAVSGQVLKDWAFVVAGVTVCVLVWWKVGFVASSFLLALALVQRFERETRWWKSIVFSGALAAVIWLIFALALHVPVRVVG